MRFVSVIMGSKSDYEIMRHCLQVLESFVVPYEVIISSASPLPQARSTQGHWEEIPLFSP